MKRSVTNRRGLVAAAAGFPQRSGKFLPVLLRNFFMKIAFLSLQSAINRHILNDMARENASVAQLVEHHVANVIVAGSIPVTRSIFLSFFRLLPPFFRYPG